jgi:hypothetical protein
MSQSETATEGQNAGNETAGQAPDVDLPDQVPDFVSDVLGAISEGASGLGQAVSEIASGANPADIAPHLADVAVAIPV